MVMVYCKDEDDPKALAELCRPKNTAQLTTHNLAQTEWHFYYDNGAKLTIRKASYAEKDV